MNCEKTPHCNTRCSYCGKKGHLEAACWSAALHGSSGVPNNIREKEEYGKPDQVNIVCENHSGTDYAVQEVVIATKRTAGGEDLPQQTRLGNYGGILISNFVNIRQQS